ncbi:MAG: DeoR family transcriptional regulator, partial [Spirochaetaceae bacterium]|nr:DeoR family transcriptional regulator [Spirochaetaceae bacterium]
MTLELNTRERAIISRLSEDGAVSVANLAKELGYSEVTIRGDLKLLEEKGWINRTRGGAAPAL